MIIILTGPSCIGKTSIEETVLRVDDIDTFKIHTSRSKRDSDSPDYYSFHTVDEIINNDKLYIYAKLTNDWLYAVDIDKVKSDKKYIFSIITNKSAKRLKEILVHNGLTVKIVHLDKCVHERTECMKKRGESEESISGRLNHELKDISIDELSPDIRFTNYQYDKDFDSVVYDILNMYEFRVRK